MSKRKIKTRRNHKDSLFCDLFSDPVRALSLYNAINGTDYHDPSELQIVTLKDVLLLHQKNDVSVLFDAKLTLWEHQSSLNHNMPIRGLLYFAQNMEGIIGDRRRMLYQKRVVRIPTPAYYVLYNGMEDAPERTDLLLSDAFLVPTSGYEWTAHMLNINLGRNKELMEHCPELKGYATLVQSIRDYRTGGLELNDAVVCAIEKCIEDGILGDYLETVRGEAMGMILTEFDEKEWEEAIREESREEGRQEGEDMLAALLKKLDQGSEDYGLALNGTNKDRQALYKKYNVTV